MSKRMARPSRAIQLANKQYGERIRHKLVITDIMTGLLAGMSKAQIADQLGIDPAQVNVEIEQAMASLTAETESLIEQYRILRYRRVEAVLARVMQSILRVPDDKDIPTRLVGSFAKLVKLQDDGLGVGAMALPKGATVNIQQNNFNHVETTMTATSDLYRTMLHQVRDDLDADPEPLLVALAPGDEPPTQSDGDESLDEMLDHYLPEHERGSLRDRLKSAIARSRASERDEDDDDDGG